LAKRRAAKKAGTALTWVAARPDGALLGIGSETGRFFLWSLARKAVVGSFDAGDFVVRARWTPDGARLLTATLGGRVLVRDGDQLDPLGELKTGHGRLRGLALSPDGKRLATCGEDAAARVWNAETLAPELELKDGESSAVDAGFASGAVVVGCGDGCFVAWSEDGRKKLVFSGAAGYPGVSSLAVHPSGRSVVFGGEKGGLREFVADARDGWKAGEAWNDTPPKPIAVNALEYAPDGRLVAAFSDDGACVFSSSKDFFGTRLGEPFYRRAPKPMWEEKFIVSGACFVPGTDLVATSHFDGAARLWRGGECVETIRPTLR
jgi:WD40 repeat protein